MNILTINNNVIFKKAIAQIILIVFLSISAVPVHAQSAFSLPVPGAMVLPSQGYVPVHMLGMTLNPENPLQINFIIDRGDDVLEGDAFLDESQKLLSYFYATMTVPEDEMWVNLSPYEENRIIADGLGNTVLGRDMLAQDYMLKQLSASIAYPEEEKGKQFWNRVRQKVKAEFGEAEIPMNTFNKIWIVPDNAKIYTHENSVFVVENYLKVMLEEDYLALEHNSGSKSTGDPITGVTNEIVREILIPEIEYEVNYGKNFAPLRQMFHSMVLATWYKQNLRSSILTQSIANKNKTDGVNVDDPQAIQKIYDQYVEAFNVGVYDYIKEEMDVTTNEMIPRKYFSGGVLGKIGLDRAQLTNDFRDQLNRDFAMIESEVRLTDAAMSSSPTIQDLETKMYAVHATPILPWDGFLRAGVASGSNIVKEDQDPNFRPTLHFSLGEVVSMHGRSTEYPYAVVTPLGNIANQLVNVFPTDTIVLGDVELTDNTIVVVPQGADVSKIPDGVSIVEYSETEGLKEAVDRVIENQEGWNVSLPDDFDKGLPAIVEGFDINSALFFQSLIDKYPQLSFGTHISSQIGQAGIFGKIDQVILSISKQYNQFSPELGTKTNQVALAVINFYLEMLDGILLDSNLPEEAKKVYQTKKVELNGWLNIVKLDLMLRDQQRRTLADAPKEILDLFKENRNNFETLIALMNEHMIDLPFSRSMGKDHLAPSYWGNVLQILTVKELEEFMSEHSELVAGAFGNEFYLNYGLSRWLTIKTENAVEEGLDEVVNRSISGMTENDVDLIESLLFSAGQSNVAKSLRNDSNRLTEALSILQLPAVKEFLGKNMNIRFAEDGPRSIEDVLRAYPDTKMLFLQDDLNFGERDQSAYEMLKQMGEVNIPEIEDIANMSFEDADYLAMNIRDYKRRLFEQIETVKNSMNTTIDIADLRIGDDMDLYTRLRYQRGSGSLSLIWKSDKLAQRFNELFPNEEDFWNSEKSMLEIFEEMDAAQISSSPDYGGIDFNANNLNLSSDGDSMQFNFPLMGINPANVNGIHPVILNVIPIPNLPMLLGLKQEDELELISSL